MRENAAMFSLGLKAEQFAAAEIYDVAGRTCELSVIARWTNLADFLNSTGRRIVSQSTLRATLFVVDPPKCQLLYCSTNILQGFVLRVPLFSKAINYALESIFDISFCFLKTTPLP